MMRTLTRLPILLLACSSLSAVGAVVSSGEGGTVDLTRPPNYANQPKPVYINRDNTPQGNEITDHGATLGRVLFYDKRLSRNDTVSCASCHQQEHGFSDPDIASSGVAGLTNRHSMRLINARFANEVRFFWDERATSLEEQATQPIHDPTEMGFSGENGDPGFSELITKLAAIEEYQVMFTAVYGDGGVTEQRMQQAMAEFMRSIQSFDSKYDVGRIQAGNDQAPFPNFTAAENEGKRLFLTPPGGGGPGAPPGVRGAGCAGCHQPPTFDIDPNSGHNGVTGSLSGGVDLTVTRAPTLRDLVDANGNPHGNFMHNAQFATLDQVIGHYNAIPEVRPRLDPRLSPGGQPQRLNLTATDRANLVAFLETLTGTNVYTDPKWSSPFDENGELSIVVLPSNGMEVSFSGVGEAREATVFMAEGVPQVEYLFQSSGDLDAWSSTPVTAAINGQVSVTVPAPVSEGQRFYRFAYVVE